jgi:hypothetical protein
MGTLVHGFRSKWKQHFLDVSVLRKLLYLSLVSCLGSTVGVLFYEKLPFLGFFIFVFLVSLLALFVLFELGILFSKSVFDGIPKKPSMGTVRIEFSLFFAALLAIAAGLAIATGAARSLMIAIGLFLVALVTIIILKWIFSSLETHDITYGTAGRIFTYCSLSTVWYVVIATLASLILVRILQDTLSKVEVTITSSIESILPVVLFLILVIAFFVIKESIFEQYGRKLASFENKEFKNEKRTSTTLILGNLESITRGDDPHIERLKEEIELLEKKILYIDQHIKENESKFEFRRSLKLAIIISPVSIPISAMIAKILELMNLL